MNRLVTVGIAFCLFAAVTTSLADSYITDPSTGNRLYKWDGTYISKPSTNERLFKYDGKYLSRSNTRLLEIKGVLPIAVIIGLATGLL